jgi:GTP pyrophosphokinase
LHPLAAVHLSSTEYRTLMNLTDRFSDAVTLALRMHRGQKRKLSGTPFAAHLLRVAGTVLEHGADEDTAIAAVLHDAIEDQGGPEARERIASMFGRRVARIVDECSDTDEVPKPPWRTRKERYLAHLVSASPSARMISAADKLDNLRSLLVSYRQSGEAVWEQFRGGRDGTLWYFRSVRDILQQSGPSLLVAELARTLGELEREIVRNHGDA